MSYEMEHLRETEKLEPADKNQQEQPWDDTSKSEMAAAVTAEESYALPQKKALNRGTIVLLASCFLGVGGIFLVGRFQGTQTTSATDKEVEVRVDTALAKLVKEKKPTPAKEVFGDTEEMVQAFYEYPAKQQVSVDELQRNPFSRALAKDEGAGSVDDALKRMENLRKELTKKLQALKLQSVLQGAGVAQCLINGEVYGEGEIVDIFKVKTIKSEQVLLLANDMEFVLKM